MEKNRPNFKTEPSVVEIKKEDIMLSEYSEDEYTSKPDFFMETTLPIQPVTHNIKKENPSSECTDQKCIKTETDDDSSDEFIENAYPWIKTEKLEEFKAKGHENQIDNAFFDLELREAYIKEDIKIGDPKIEVKTEKLCEFDKYENESNNSYFDQEINNVNIKEEIEIEDHKIKLEIVKDDTEAKHKHEGPLNTETTKSILKCKFCSYETPFQSSFKKHLSLHEDPSKIRLYFCTKCNYRTRQKCHLKRHDLVHTSLSQLELFTCKLCGFKTKQKCTLKRHISNVHTKEMKKKHKKKYISPNGNIEQLSCSKCSYTTFKRGLLLAHLDKHKDANNLTNIYICDICSFSTKYRRNLRMHLDTHKDSQKLQTYECKLCKFKTRIGYCLKRHLLSKKHLKAAGQLEQYVPRPNKL